MTRTVLLVDDDPLVRLVMSDMLDELGFSVTEVGSPAEAITTLGQAGAPDLLITDILMPEMDGWTFAEQVRTSYPELPIVYITGYSAETDRPVNRARVVRKPFTTRTLAKAVGDLLL